MCLIFQALFCSEKCLQEGNKRFHNVMCPILADLEDLWLYRHDLLSMQIVTDLGLNQLKEKVAKYKTEDCQVTSKTGFNENGQYCSDEYETIYHLETNFKKRDIKTILKYGLKVVRIVKVLLQTPFFGSNVNADNSSTKEDIILTGSIILMHILSFNCNAHGIQEYQCNQKEFAAHRLDYTPIGSGVFALCSLLNHSCDPTVSRSCHGKKLAIFAIRSMRKGDEITDSYGCVYAADSLAERKMELSSYYFECTCRACVNPDIWLNRPALEEYPYVFCPACKKHVAIVGHCCKDLKICNIFTVITGKLAQLSSVMEGNNLQNLNPKTKTLLIETISALEKYDVRPCNVFFMCQEMLKCCQLIEGNLWFYVDNNHLDNSSFPFSRDAIEKRIASL